MRATRAYISLRLPNGVITYINDKGMAELYVRLLADMPGAARAIPTQGEQQLDVIAAGLEFQKAISGDQAITPLTQAVRGLRQLTSAFNQANT